MLKESWWARGVLKQPWKTKMKNVTVRVFSETFLWCVCEGEGGGGPALQPRCGP